MKVLEEFSEKEESFLVYQSRLAATIAARSEEADRQRMREEAKQLRAETEQLQAETEQLQAKKEQLQAESEQLKGNLEQLVTALLADGNMTIEQIASMANMPIEQVKVIQANNQ